MDRKWLAIESLKSHIEYVKSGNRVNTYPVCIEVEEAENILALLKEQEESIPVSWLTEKLEGHPELPYAVTDGINNVLELWEGR